MFDTGRKNGKFATTTSTEEKAAFEKEVQESTFPNHFSERAKRESVARDCAHRWLHGGTYRCVVCGIKMYDRAGYPSMVQ